MQAIYRLKPHKPQRNGLSLLQIFLRKLYNLCYRGLCGILNVFKTNGRFVDRQFDLFRCFGDFDGFDDDGFDANGLVELLGIQNVRRNRRNNG